MTLKPVLRFGSRGPDVVDLQTKLNLKPPTTLSPLIPDGVFGQQTQSRVKAFQQHHHLVADGIVGPNTWAAIDAASPTQPVPPRQPPHTPPPPGTVAKKIIDAAQAQIGAIDYTIREGPSMEPHGWQHLGTILDKAAGLKYPDVQLKASPNPGGLSWCGIFCVYCYQLAGKQVTWKLNIGAVGQVKKVNQWDTPTHAAFEALIQPGDIAVIAERSHHFIIASTNPATGAIESIDGNLLAGRINKLTTRRLSQVVAFYRPV